MECPAFVEFENAVEAKTTSFFMPAVSPSSLRNSLNEDHSRRHSIESVNSVDDEGGHDYPVVYSEEEMHQIITTFSRLYKQYFGSHTLSMIPQYSSVVLDDVYSHLSSDTYIDASTMEVLVPLLASLQIRLFHIIFNQYYSSFVVTDLFEYLVNEIRFPSTDPISFRLLRRATSYSMSRLKNCEEEIPHVRKFIQRRNLDMI